MNYVINVQVRPNLPDDIAPSANPMDFISEEGSRVPVSPVFNTLGSLFGWMLTNGWYSAECALNILVPWRVEKTPGVEFLCLTDLFADRIGFDGPGWYHWDESWTHCHGPYRTGAEAARALRRYAESL